MITQRHLQQAMPTVRELSRLSLQNCGEQQEKEEDASRQQDQTTDQAALTGGGSSFLAGPGRFPLPHAVIIRGNPGGMGHVPRVTQWCVSESG